MNEHLLKEGRPPAFSWKTRRTFAAVLLWFSFFSGFPLLFAQEGVQADTTAGPAPASPANGEPAIPSSYGSYPLAETTAAIALARESGFNQGLISDPAQLFQGKLAGVQVYNRGGNPNSWSLIRVRGLSAYSQRQPLFVVDGLAGASIANLDPNDIASIAVLKDGSSQALYGIRASNGVVLITTKSGAEAGSAFSASYTGQLAGAVPYPGIPVMDAATFREAGGLDFGSSTNWLEEIQRNGLSQNHGLAIQGKRAGTHYRISGNYRPVEGILRGSGFEQANLRAHLNSSFLKGKLSWQLSGAYSSRSSQFGFPEAFRHATSYNPTAPILARDAPFPVNTSQFGGFFEVRGLFDAFNPKAIVALNSRYGQQELFNAVSLLTYALGENLSLHARYAYQDQFVNERAFYSPQSLFGGNAGIWPEGLEGRASLADTDESLSLYEFFTTYRRAFGTSRLNLMLGTAYSDGRHRDQSMSLTGFTDEARVRSRRIGSFSSWVEEAVFADTSRNGWASRLSAFFGQAHLNIKDRFFFDASLRYEGSSKLGDDSRWGLFPALGAAVDISHHFPAFEQFKLRASYGVTGALPDQAGLAKERIRITIIPDSTSFSEVIRQANPDLSWEQKEEFNIGLGLQAGLFSGSIDWYRRRVSGWISMDLSEIFNGRYTNQNALTSSGVDLSLDLRLWQGERFEYSTGARLSAYRAKYAEVAQDLLFLTNTGGSRTEPLIVGKEGEAVGNILGPRFSGLVDEFGEPVFEDLNGDGQASLHPDDPYGPESDLTVIGNGLPDVELGWIHQLRLGKWELHAFFRAALGHSLANRQRQLWEPRGYTQNVYNVVNTSLALEDLQAYRYSSLYVERADFLKLDYLSLAHTFPFRRKGESRLKVSLTVQNVLLASRYTGADPEPALEDVGPRGYDVSLNAPRPDPLAPGISRLNDYLPATSFVLGVQAVF